MKKITVKLKENTVEFFRFQGVASDISRDAHGEIVIPQGIDLCLVPSGKVIVNIEHEEPSVGFIESAHIIEGQLYVEGIVFNRNIYTNKIYQMLKLADPVNPVSLSIEFVNIIKESNDTTVFSSVLLTGVALVGINEDPANKNTYAELIKSFENSELISELFRRAEKSSEFKARLLKILGNA